MAVSNSWIGSESTQAPSHSEADLLGIIRAFFRRIAASPKRALDQADRLSKTSTLRRTAAVPVATLMLRQHEIMDRAIAG